MSYQSRKIAGLCTRCGKPSLEDSTLCEPCRVKNQARAKRWFAKRWQARKKAKQCVDCGVGLKSRGLVRCPACRIRRGIVHRQAAVLSTGLDQRGDRIADRTTLVTEGDGRTRARYHGKHRGRASAAEMDAEDVRAVRSSLQRLEDGLAVARSAEVLALPRIQREEALIAALSHADVARRFLEDLLWRHDYPMERERNSVESLE